MSTHRSPIEYALIEIYSQIPVEILNLAFAPENFRSTLDDLILDKVIQMRVLSDCNIVGGHMKDIPLIYEYVESTVPMQGTSYLASNYHSLYRIPPEVRDNRIIVAVHKIKYPYTFTNVPSMTFNAQNFGATMESVTDAVLNSHTFGRTPALPTPILRAGDLVQLDPPQSTHIDYFLECRLGYDKDFLNLNNQAIAGFQKMCLYAVRAYIYNELIIKLDRAAMEGGMEISSIKDIVSSYADSNEKYEEALKRFQGGSLLDVKRIKNVLRHMW